MGKKKTASKLARRKAAGKLAAKGGARAVPGAGQVLMVAEGAPVAVEGLRRTGETWWAGTKRSIGHAREGGAALGRGKYTEAAGHFGRGGLESGKTALASQWELTKGAGRTAVAALLAREAAEATYYEDRPGKKKRKKRKKAKKNAGFSYRPQDLFPVQVEDRIYPARWHDVSEGRVVLTGWKAVTPEVHQVSFLLDGYPMEGWFHQHGELWYDEAQGHRPGRAMFPSPPPSWVPPVKANPLSRREQEIQRRELAERERQRWREEIYAIRGQLEDLRVLARAAEPEALARIERLQRRRAYLQRKLSQSMEEQRREAPLPEPRFEGGDLEDWSRVRKEQRQYLGRRGRKRKGMLVKKNPWAPSGKVWEHRRWHLPRGAATSAAPEVFYWDDLNDAFRSDDPQEEEWAAELRFHRTPRGGWRWSHDDGMGGTYRHEAHLVPRRRRARFNPRRADVGLYQDVLAHLRALQWIYWTTHWRTSGPTFYGDHLMLQRLYAGENGGPNINEEIDQLGERMVVYFGRDSVQPDVIGAKVQAILTGSGKSRGASMAWVLLTVEMYLQDAIRKAWQSNQDSGRHMSLGLDDYLMGLANERETAIYLLRQVQEERLAPLAER